MKSASSALITLLNSGQNFLMADLFTFTLVGGFVARYTNVESSITVGGHTFNGNDIIIARSKTRIMIGVEVDTMDMTVNALPSHLLNGTPWLQAVRQGALDGASLLVERLFMPTWGDTSCGTVILFSGTVAGADVGRTSAKLTVNSLLSLLNVQMPRNVFQPPCRNVLYDGGCTLSKAAFGVAGTSGSGSTASVIVTGLSNPAGYFSLGTITFNTGANTGVSRSVKVYASGNAQLALPLLTAPTTGDAFTIYAGCDHTQATCVSKFNNVLNFRGEPYIPIPETAI